MQALRRGEKAGSFEITSGICAIFDFFAHAGNPFADVIDWVIHRRAGALGRSAGTATSGKNGKRTKVQKCVFHYFFIDHFILGYNIKYWNPMEHFVIFS